MFMSLIFVYLDVICASVALRVAWWAYLHESLITSSSSPLHYCLSVLQIFLDPSLTPLFLKNIFSTAFQELFAFFLVIVNVDFLFGFGIKPPKNSSLTKSQPEYTKPLACCSLKTVSVLNKQFKKVVKKKLISNLCDGISLKGRKHSRWTKLVFFVVLMGPEWAAGALGESLLCVFIIHLNLW